MEVRFSRRADGGSLARIERPDGVTLRLRSYDCTHAIPHDLAHLVAERAFRIQGGLWGSIAAGALFGSLEVVAGRLRHDRRARSTAVLRANVADLGRAEVLAGVVHQGVSWSEKRLAEELRAAWGVFSADPCPIPVATAVGAVAELRELGVRWAALGAADELALTWPHAREASRRSARRSPRPRR